jgi:hypothetical protein
MNTESLTALLHEATDDLETRPGFAGAVLRGGRRRQFRRRMVMATSAATAVALLGGGTYVVVHQDGTEQTTAADDPLLTQPTKGDLAGDQEFLAQAITEWRTGLTHSPFADQNIYDDMRGEPHVYWAGNTPAGKVAVVAQQVNIHLTNPARQNENGPRTAAGLVAIDPKDGKLKLVTDQWEDGDASPQTNRVGDFRFGPDDRTVLITTNGKPIYYSTEPLLRDNKLVRDWHRMPEKDGVALVELPEDIDPAAALVVERDSQPGPEYMERVGSFGLSPASRYLTQAGGDNTINPPQPTGIRWSYETLSVGSTGGPQFDINKTYIVEVATKLEYSGGGYAGGYYIRAGLPDGRVAVLSDLQNDAHPARFYVLLVTPDLKYSVYDGGDVNAGEALPVHFRLPDQQGWIIAQLNQPLKYRTSTTGEWQDAGVSAALVPDETVQVQVGDTVVNLPR